MRKNIIFLSALSGLFFLLGVGLFLVKRDWIILHWVPSYKRSEDISEALGKKVAPKKITPLFYWYEDKLKQSEESFVWLASKTERLRLLVGSWLTLLYEERILEKRVRIESVALSQTEQEGYLSFDQVPFLSEWPIYKKWRLLDGLCRTVEAAGLDMQTLIFLVRNEPMTDEHLDFSHPWPVSGFL